MMKLVKVCLIFNLIMICFVSFGQIYDVTKYGAKGDGIANDYPALLNAVKDLNRQGRGKLILPKGTYYIENYHTATSNLEDIVFKGLSSLEIVGNGSKIVLNAKFHRNIERTKGQFSYSHTKTVIPLNIVQCKNVVIRDLEIDGGARYTTRDAKVIESGGRLLILSNSHQVTLYNLKLHHALSDGIYITQNSSNIAGNNITSYSNARQGMSIIHGTNMEFKNSKFNNNGDTDGKYGGHSPKSGVDIEPAAKGDRVENILFRNCEFSNNVASQILISKPSATRNVLIDECRIDAGQSKGAYQLVLAAKEVRVSNSSINCGSGSLYALWNDYPDNELYLNNNTISSSGAGIMAVSKKKGAKVVIENNTLTYTGAGPVGKYFPYIIADIEFVNNKVVIPKIRKGAVNSIVRAKRSTGNTFSTGAKSFKVNTKVN